MATAKNKKAAANKKSPAKPAAKKAKAVKAVAKKAAKTPAKKAVKVSSKKSAPAAKKSAVKKSPAKTVAAKPTRPKSSGKTVVSKASKASPVAAKAKPASKQTDLKTAKKPDVTSKKPEVKAKPVAEKSSKPEKKSGFTAPVTQAPKKGKDVKTVAPKPEKPGKPSKSKKKEDEEDGEEGPDPLHLKADKVIKELEEIMDLTKMRPRIQAGTSPKQTIVKPAHPPLKLIEPSNTLKEKFQLEFEFRSSPKILFTSLSDSSGLAGWFADEVKTKDDLYTFIWEGGESYARLVAIRELQLVRFQWLDDTDGTYFQFEIKEDDITSDIALVITDFANPGEKDSSIKLWESQVQNLRMLLGSL